MELITSWDDGYPADMKVADLLDRHGLSGTFFVPLSNSEGLSVLDTVALRELDKRFEIGSHTRSHIRLDRIKDAVVDEEILCGKEGLEEILGHKVDGFCYPDGRVTSHALNSLRTFGIGYARTVENFRLDVGDRLYNVPTTLQIFPHSKQVYVRNLIRHGNLMKRAQSSRIAFTGSSLWHILDCLVEICSARHGVLHVWGHSWEIERYDMWRDLDAFFSRIKPLVTESKTVAESVSHLVGVRLPGISKSRIGELGEGVCE